MQFRFLIPITGLGLAMLAAPLVAQDAAKGNISISDPWTRETAASQTVGGGFMTIRNNGQSADRLLSIASSQAAEVQIHTMRVEAGVMKMRQVQGGIAIPAGKAVTLKPGATHIMFIGLKKPFKPGDMIPATLTFERAGSVKVRFAVQAIGTTSAAEAHHAGH